MGADDRLLCNFPGGDVRLLAFAALLRHALSAEAAISYMHRVSAILIAVAAVLLALCALVTWASRWLARSWEVVDDDALRQHTGTSTFWFYALGWLRPNTPRLTYRRDERGRFRRHRR